MPITTLPPAPEPTDSTSQFNAKSFAWVAALDQFTTEANDLAVSVNNDKNTTESIVGAAQVSANASASSASNAALSASAALTHASAAAANTNAPLWVSGTTYAASALVYSALTGRTYRRKTAGGGTTDPSLDSTNWIPLFLEIETQRPSIRPSLLLDFANTKQLDPRVTFSRASTGTYFDSNGVLQTAAAGVARFDHDPITGESKGLLIEEQRSNLLTYSEQFDNAAWSKGNSSITSNTIVAPDGTLTGDKLVENTATGQHRMSRNVSGTTNTNANTKTIYVKAGERNRIYIGIAESPTFSRQGNAVFDLTTGTVVNVSTGINGATGGSATIEHVGNGIYRCSYTLTLGGTDTSIFIDINIVNTGSTISYTGNGYSGLYILGAQLEAGAFPTSYIPTVASQVTRSADTASMTGANFSSWYRADEGSFYIDFADVKNPSASLFALDDGTTSQRIINILNGITTQAAFRVVNGGVDQANFSPSSFAAFSNVKYASAYKVNDFAAVTNSGTVATDTAGTIPVVTTARIGQNVAGGSHINGTIKKLAFYPARLSNTQLQAITS